MSLLSYTETVLRYFNPSRSPFYGIIAIGVFSMELVHSAGQAEKDPLSLGSSRWWLVNALLLFVITISVRFSLKDKTTMSRQEYTDQLFFARSICVAVALISLAHFSRHYEDNPRYWTVVVLSAIQSATFLIYIWATPTPPEDLRDTNYVQLGLITATLMLGTVFLLEPLHSTNPAEYDWGKSLEFNAPAAVLFVLWLACLRVWWRLIRKLVIFMARTEDIAQGREAKTHTLDGGSVEDSQNLSPKNPR